MLRKVVEPETYCGEGVLICEVEAHEYATHFIVEHSGYVSKALLASSVPHEQLYKLSRLELIAIRVSVS